MYFILFYSSKQNNASHTLGLRVKYSMSCPSFRFLNYKTLPNNQ